jgi:DNA replication licensing factor MCM6
VLTVWHPLSTKVGSNFADKRQLLSVSAEFLLICKCVRVLTEQGSGEGLKRSDVVAWYLEQVQEQIETEDELLERKTLVEKVIDRLIYHVSYRYFSSSVKLGIKSPLFNEV